MRDFWLSCGHHLLDRDGGGLVVTDEFLKAYFARTELVPPEDACPAEKALHAELLANPRRPLTDPELAAIADPDARENWRLIAAFRDRLIAQPTLEAAYLDLVRSGGIGTTPPLFVNQLVHAILRNILDDCQDAFMLRAAELFFRPQRLTAHQGSLIAADEETVAGASPQPVSPLVAMLGLEPGGNVDVLNEENEQSYWQRSDAFDMALDLTAGRPGLTALGRVIERWLSHLLSIRAEVEPLIEAIDVKLSWYIGLDTEATRMGDALWNGEALDRSERERIVGLFALNARDEGSRIDAQSPIYLLMAMTSDRLLRMKPQNLIVGLPAARLAAVS